jgi:hypothetical protein
MEKCIINNNEFDFILSNDSQNVISISEKIESFSDVFECTLNDQKIILEKVGEINGDPLVYIDLKYKGKKYVTDAVLVNGDKSYIKINETNLHLIKSQENLITDNTIKEDQQVLIEKIENETSDVMINFLGETLEKYSDDRLKIKLDKYDEIYNEKIDLLETKKNQTLKHLEEEFDKNLRLLKDDIQDRLQLFLKETDKENKDSIQLRSKQLSNEINEKYDNFITEVKSLKEFTSKNISNVVEGKYAEISELVENYINNISNETKLLENLQEKFLKDSKKKVNEANKELKEIKNNITLLEVADNKKIEKQNKVIQDILEDSNDKFNKLNEKFKLLSEKKNDEYNKLLAAVNNKEVVEYKTILKEKIQDVELTQVKDELIKEVTENFSQDMRGLRRYVEMSSGGGTNAVQYANGGTMNGDLTVTGTMEADTILANTLLSSTNLDIGFELSGFNVTGNLSANGDLSASKITSTGFIGFETTQTGAGVTLKGDVDNGSGFFSSNFSDGSDGPRTGQFYQQGNDLFLNSVGGNDTHGDIQLATGDVNNGPVERVTIKGDTGRVGIGDKTPSEMLEVAGNVKATGFTSTDDMSAKDIIKSNRLNVGGGNLFVDDGTSTGNAFVKMGAYGAGNFFGKEGSVNGAAFSLGVGTAGKIVEDMRIDTFALSGAGLVNKNTNPVILVASPGANKYIVPVSIQVYKSQSGGTRVSWAGSGQAAISIGTFASSDTTGTFSQLTSLPRVVALIDGDWLYNRNQGPDTQTRIHSNRALALRTSVNISSNTSADVYYLKVRYMVMSEDGDFKSIGNLQIKDA